LGGIPDILEEDICVVSKLVRRFRGLIVALVALALSAGVAFAWGGPPDAANKGLGIAADASGQTVPARAEEQPTAGTDEETEEEAPETEAPETEAPETEAPEDDSAATDTHGALVSEAAQMETPAAFTDAGLNHGAFVSCVARMNHGHEDPEADTSQPVDLTTLTPEACGITTEATTQSTKAPKAHGNTKDHSTHGKSANARGHSR
jgi:hypothetical protein